MTMVACCFYCFFCRSLVCNFKVEWRNEQCTYEKKDNVVSQTRWILSDLKKLIELRLYEYCNSSRDYHACTHAIVNRKESKLLSKMTIRELAYVRSGLYKNLTANMLPITSINHQSYLVIIIIIIINIIIITVIIIVIIFSCISISNGMNGRKFNRYMQYYFDRILYL